MEGKKKIAAIEKKEKEAEQKFEKLGVSAAELKVKIGGLKKAVTKEKQKTSREIEADIEKLAQDWKNKIIEKKDYDDRMATYKNELSLLKGSLMAGLSIKLIERRVALGEEEGEEDWDD